MGVHSGGEYTGGGEETTTIDRTILWQEREMHISIRLNSAIPEYLVGHVAEITRVFGMALIRALGYAAAVNKESPTGSTSSLVELNQNIEEANRQAVFRLSNLPNVLRMNR